MDGSEFLKTFEKDFPRNLAYDWDNVGVLVGTLNKPINAVLVTLDVTKETVKKAKEIGAELIIAHHPLIFESLNAIHYDTYKGQLIRDIIKADITVYTAHTNYDIAPGGMNDMLAEKIGLVHVKPFEMVDETNGLGRIGLVKNPKALKDTIEAIKTTLDIPNARYIGKDKDKTIEKIAIIGGSSAEFAKSAKDKGADLYITSDVTYHKAHDMLQMGQRALDIGHSSEKHFKTAIKTWLHKYFKDLEVYVYEDSQDPFTQV